MEGSTVSDHDLVELLHARGHRVTPQRLVILRELRGLATHCTAEEIRAAVRKSLPGTSTPTVYATLELLGDLGLVRQIHAGGAAVLYDAGLEPHQHAVCRGCDEVRDVDGPLEARTLVEAAAADGFTPTSAELVIFGLCERCAAATGVVS
jgi:Fe2+ or Zn2+ uptake regulation protein